MFDCLLLFCIVGTTAINKFNASVPNINTQILHTVSSTFPVLHDKALVFRKTCFTLIISFILTVLMIQGWRCKEKPAAVYS